MIKCFALNAKTFAIVGEIPFTSCSVTNVIGGIGSWTLTAPQSFLSPNGVELLTTDNFDPCKTVVVFMSGEIPVLMGIFGEEDGTIDESSETVSFGGPEAALGYLDRRRWSTAAFTYSVTEQFTIASGIIVRSWPNGLGPIGAQLVVASNGAVFRDRTYRVSDNKTLYELFSELAAVENGFDFTSGVTGTQETSFRQQVIVGYPSLYRRTGIVLQLGKNIKQLSWSKAGSRYANDVYVSGADKSELQPLGRAVKTEDLASYPLYTASEQRSSVILQSTLQEHANQYLKVYGAVPVKYSVSVSPDDPDCAIGSFRCGDEVRLIADRGRVKVDSMFRIESWTIGVGEEGETTLVLDLFETGTGM